MKLHKHTFRVFTVILLLSSCYKPYEEGSNFSFRSALKRISGIYSVSEFTVNGNDSLPRYLNTGHHEFVLSFNKELTDGDRQMFFIERHPENEYGHFSLENDNKILKIEIEASPNIISPFFKGAEIYWEIIKLTKDELKMKTEYSGSNYLLHLNRINNK